MSIKCFDVVSMVIDEATAQFAPVWTANRENKKILEQYCEAIDELAKEFQGISYEVNVDTIKMTIGIKMECGDIILNSKTNTYYKLAQRAISFGFSQSEDGNLVAEFVFPSIWEKV